MTKALKNALPYVLTLILVGIMTFVAEILGEGEIIFPEITALAIGYMVTQKQGWKVNDSRMIALIAICAVAGVLTVRYIKVGLYLEILIAFVFAQILFMLSGTTFAPMISAIVLPVMMQTESFIYPIAAFLLTIAVVLFLRFLLKVKIRDKEDFQSVNMHAKSDVIDTVVRTICVAVVGFFAIWSGFKFAIAPPLLVAFTEFSRPKNKARNKPVKTILVITVCAFVGSVSRIGVLSGSPYVAAVDENTIRRLVTGIKAPLNIILNGKFNDFARLGKLGVRRLSIGSSLVRYIFDRIIQQSDALNSGKVEELLNTNFSCAKANAYFK